MKGSTGFSKSDINSTLAPTTTADTNAKLQNTTESANGLKRPEPILLGASERDAVQAEKTQTKNSFTEEKTRNISSLQQNINHHTEPVVSSSGGNSQVKSNTHLKEKNLKEIVTSLAEILELALNTKDLNQLEVVIKGLESNNLRLDRPPISTSEGFKLFSLAGAIDVITFMKDAVTDQAADLLIRMIRLGCNVNVTDKSGNSVLMHACKAGRFPLVKILLTECPNIRKDWLNEHGQNAAMLAYKYGNSQLYPLLEQAGISRHPENPAIKFYLSSSRIVDGTSSDSDSESEEYVELFKENNFMNLADENGQTLLFHAVIHEDVDFVSFLCKQEQFLNVALRDKNQKSVFYYINQIKDPGRRSLLFNLINAKGKQTAWLYELASYNFLGDK